MLEIVLTGAIVIGLVVHVILISKIENLERRIKTLNAKINLIDSKRVDLEGNLDTVNKKVDHTYHLTLEVSNENATNRRALKGLSYALRDAKEGQSHAE